MKNEKIKKMSMIEIVEKVGMPAVLLRRVFNEGQDYKTEGVLRQAYVYSADKQETTKFESEIKKLQNIGTIKDFVKVLDKYQYIIDKELYVFLMTGLISSDTKGRNMEQLATFPNSKKDKKVALKYVIELLKDIDVVVPRFTIKDGKYDIDAVISSQEYIGNTNFLKKRKKENDERFKQIDETIGLKEVLKPLVPSDMLTFFVYPNLGNLIANNIYNNVRIDDSLTDDELNRIKEFLEKNKNGHIFINEDLEEEVKRNTEYIDVDKMLILSNIYQCFRNKKSDDSYDYDDYIKMKEFSQKIGTLLKNKRASVKIQEDVIDYKSITTFLDELENHFINKKFYHDYEIDELRHDILEDTITVSSFSKEDFSKIMRFINEELAVIVTNQPEALEYLVENDFINTSRINAVINLKKDFTDDQVLYLISKGIVENEDVLEMYNKGKFSVDNIRYVQDKLDKFDISSMTSVEKLVKLYLDPSKKEEFDKYRKIFKALKIDETLAENRLRRENEDNKKVLDELDSKLKERQIEVSSNILDQSLELLEVDKLYDLYRMGLIHIDVLVDFVGPTAINDLYATGELKPLDARKLYDDGIIDENTIVAVLKDGKLSETQKLVLIYSTFPSMEDKDKQIREKLISYMNEIDNVKKIPNSNYDKNNINDASSYIYNKHVTDPCARWNLIANIDKDYSQDYLTDGTIIFYMPNEQKYIVEKLYDKNNKPAYGAATYILEEKLFNEIKKDLIINQKIDRSCLIELNKQKNSGIKKIIHTGWANSMTKFFDLENEEKYSKEQIEKIRKLADEVEMSKTKLKTKEDNVK